MSPSPPCSLVHTFGCRLNQFDGDALTRMLGEAGFPPAGSPERAKVHVVNSCTITEEAKKEAEKFSRALARQYPSAHIVWTGCAASSAEGQALLALPNVEMVIDNAQKTDLPRRLAAHLSFATETSRVAHRELPVGPPTTRSRALLKVQDGCDYRCSFCIVPQVRGKSRSIKVEQLKRQLSELLARDVPEVVITGVHLGTWGRELSPRLEIADLLRALLVHLADQKRACRLRLSSIDPHEWSEQATQLFVQYKAYLCRSLHLPTQSLCPETLRRMRRAHRAEHFEQAVTHLTRAIDGIGIGTDIIAGHPGETKQEFDETFARLAALPLSYLHVFGYSPRNNTAAATFPDPVAAKERKRRVSALRALSAQMHRRFVERAAGTEADVVVHLHRAKQGGSLVGMTDQFIKVRFSGPDALLGQRARVRIEAPIDGGAQGQLLRPGWQPHGGLLSIGGRQRLQLRA